MKRCREAIYVSCLRSAQMDWYSHLQGWEGPLIISSPTFRTSRLVSLLTRNALPNRLNMHEVALPRVASSSSKTSVDGQEWNAHLNCPGHRTGRVMSANLRAPSRTGCPPSGHQSLHGLAQPTSPSFHKRQLWGLPSSWHKSTLQSGGVTLWLQAKPAQLWNSMMLAANQFESWCFFTSKCRKHPGWKWRPQRIHSSYPCYYAMLVKQSESTILANIIWTQLKQSVNLRL